jgi:hypothetical protein
MNKVELKEFLLFIKNCDFSEPMEYYKEKFDKCTVSFDSLYIYAIDNNLIFSGSFYNLKTEYNRYALMHLKNATLTPCGEDFLKDL